MRALVVYESMYGNTRAVADRVAAGLRPLYEVTVVPAGEVEPTMAASADLLVVGGPTHAHGLPRRSTRLAAQEAAKKDPALALEPGDVDHGLVELFAGLPPGGGTAAAAFDTRMQGPGWLTGRAGRGIARRLRAGGFRVITAPWSFFVDRHNRLVAGEADLAQQWGAELCRLAGAVPTAPRSRAKEEAR